MDKNIACMLKIVRGKIGDAEELALRRIDTVVNAANPTLMGSDRGVDGCIHAAINRKLDNGETFAGKICRELDKEKGEEQDREKYKIRCSRGQAVMTGGYGLCRNIIHVVGSQYDGKSRGGIGCSSSRVDLLESCYYEIIKIVRSNADIENIAIPVIGAGEYGFPYELAVRIALSGIGNALVDWKNEDEELFELGKLRNIYFYIYDDNPKEWQKNYRYAEEVLNRYNLLFRNDKKVVFQNSFMAQIRYMNEIIRYDRKRGYFAAARAIRLLLIAVRFLFMPVMMIKDMIGRTDWEKRRLVVELLSLAKMFCPFLFWIFWQYGYWPQHPWVHEVLFPIAVIYGMSDTVTYLLTLIMMADIQRPSANLIRSMIMLFVNYIEVTVGLSYLYFMRYKGSITFADAVQFGILGIQKEAVDTSALINQVFVYADGAAKFFFISLVFGYFANHMKQRKFRS